MPTDFLTLTRATIAPRRPYRRDAEAQPCLLPDSIVLPGECAVFFDDGRSEPALAAAPFFVEFDEVDRLDPARAEIPPDEPVASVSSQARPIPGPIGSLLVHLLVLALLLVPSLTAPDLPKPIPIQLVLQPAPPPPAPKTEPAPAPETVRPPGRLSSEDEGDATPKTGQAPTPAKQAAAPKPAPQPKLVPPPPPPKPAPPRDEAALLELPKIPAPVLVPPPANTPPPDVQHTAEDPLAAGRMARVPGPAATKDQYLAYLVALTKQHFDLLPMTVIGDRRGETQLSVLVMADGTIARISVAQGSGYPDIDSRVEQMVAAVHRFPPLPQWYQRPSMELIFTLRFPQGLARR